ncbi:MAG: hypothetical protein HONBIEJF_02847 [Fimbriimonadaceae bacterium]|nr:hypothetical protein [Fimbriimonadaceae bacterium]
MITLAILAVLTLQNEGGLVVETIQPGTGATASARSKVEIDYTVRSEDGKTLASSIDRGLPIWMDLADPKTLPLWRRGIAGLKVGGRRKLSATPFWYGGEAKQPALIVFVTVRSVK